MSSFGILQLMRLLELAWELAAHRGMLLVQHFVLLLLVVH